MSYEALFEDEDDIFGGTPSSKFWDVLNTVNKELARNALDGIVTRYAVMESILAKEIDEERLNAHLDSCYYNDMEAIELRKKSLYMEFVGDIISKNPE